MKLDEEAFSALMRAIEDLKELAEEGAVIIVEGRRDAKALRMLGIRGRIVVSSNRSNAEIVDEVGFGKVVILTDWDERGEALKRDLTIKFSSWGVVPDVEIRRRIFSIVGREITAVEDLAEFVMRHQL